MKKIIITTICIIIFLIVLFFISARYIGTKGLIVKEYKILNTKITDDYHGLKIVHMSDIHYGSTIGEKELKKIIDKINFLKPDIVVLTGDLIDDRIECDNNTLIKYLSQIEARLGKYSISGNHDWPISKYEDIINKSGFININDTYKLIYDSSLPIIISGISSIRNSTLSKKIVGFNEYLPNSEAIYSILLVHEPDIINELDLNNYDLVLAGHSHGGQVRIPFIYKKVLPNMAKEYYEEYYKVNNTDLYISSGLGTSGYKLRLFNKPSINFYRLTNK